MSRDTILKAPNGERWSLDNLVSQGRLDGKSAGVEEAVVWVKSRAVELFEAGDDTAAVTLRTLGDRMLAELLPRLRREAEEHKKEYPPRIDD